MLPRVLTRVVDWVRAHWQFGVELETHGLLIWVFKRTWKSTEFARVAVAIVDRSHGDWNAKLTILGKIFRANGSGASFISLSLVALIS